jgi:hypothetical protein
LTAPTKAPRLWLVRPSPRKDQAALEDSLDAPKRTPRQIVADMDAGIEAAVAARFPRQRPRLADVDLALSCSRRWDALAAAVEAEHRTGIALPATRNWLGRPRRARGTSASAAKR